MATNNPHQIDAQILRLLTEHPGEGLSNARILEEILPASDTDVDVDGGGTPSAASSLAAQLGASVNRLLSQGTVEMLRQTDDEAAAAGGGGGSGFVLRLKRGSQLENASPEEQLVFSIIEESQRMGVWIRDIRERSGLNDVQLRRVLKVLEQRKIVRSIKAAGTTKKTYILCGLEADDSLSGGTFYSDQQLDSEFVQTLLHVCVNWLMRRGKKEDYSHSASNESKGFTTLQRRRTAEEQNRGDLIAQREASFVESDEVVRYIHEKGICRIQLGVADVERILDIAVLDGKLEKRLNHTYRNSQKASALSAGFGAMSPVSGQLGMQTGHRQFGFAGKL